MRRTNATRTTRATTDGPTDRRTDGPTSRRRARPSPVGRSVGRSVGRCPVGRRLVRVCVRDGVHGHTLRGIRGTSWRASGSTDRAQFASLDSTRVVSSVFIIRTRGCLVRLPTAWHGMNARINVRDSTPRAAGAEDDDDDEDDDDEDEDEDDDDDEDEDDDDDDDLDAVLERGRVDGREASWEERTGRGHSRGARAVSRGEGRVSRARVRCGGRGRGSVERKREESVRGIASSVRGGVSEIVGGAL